MIRLVVATLALVGTVACTPTVGDPCELTRQCGTTLTCDTTYPEGYCLKVGCRAGECPAEATCVDFGDENRYCMRSCSPDNECASNVVCRAAPACEGQTTIDRSQPCSMEAQSFCGVAP